MCQGIFKSTSNCSGIEKGLTQSSADARSHSLGGKEEEEEDNLPLTHHQAPSRGLALCSVLYVQKSSDSFLQIFEEDIISPM